MVRALDVEGRKAEDVRPLLEHVEVAARLLDVLPELKRLIAAVVRGLPVLLPEGYLGDEVLVGERILDVEARAGVGAAVPRVAEVARWVCFSERCVRRSWPEDLAENLPWRPGSSLMRRFSVSRT